MIIIKEASRYFVIIEIADYEFQHIFLFLKFKIHTFFVKINQEKQDFFYYYYFYIHSLVDTIKKREEKREIVSGQMNFY